MKILFYDTKPYDTEAFDAVIGDFPDITIDYLKTDISEKTVSLACGYTDANYFARVFKRITGKTPSEYRLT